MVGSGSSFVGCPTVVQLLTHPKKSHKRGSIFGVTTLSNATIPAKSRNMIISASLLALFLGALDALVMSAAMPTIVEDLGGLDLYSWVYSSYLLARTVSLPIFGKLADIYRTKTLYIVSILIFILASLAAGFADSMVFLIACRTVQGIGAGGNFALVYIVLADISTPEERGKVYSLGSFVWGLASVLGPTMGGFIVAYFSWPWIFFINVPLGVLSLVGVGRYLLETREKKQKAILDVSGALTLTIAVLSLLFIFLLTGRNYDWLSPLILTLGSLFIVFGGLFYYVERRAENPILPIHFFALRGFSVGNTAVFMSSFAIFAFFAFAPLFIQEALQKSPLEVGMTVLSLSLGWSAGSLILGRMVHRWGTRLSATVGAALLVVGCALSLTFSTATPTSACFWVFALIGVGMGFVSLATVLVVQNSVDPSDLGVATSSHQFSRNLGATVGIGICGSIFTTGFAQQFRSALAGGQAQALPEGVAEKIFHNADSVLRPAIREQIPPDLLRHINEAVANGVLFVFWVTFSAAVACLLCCLFLPREKA
jgi:EmrB/QacA subfamily drug resistance transporter